MPWLQMTMGKRISCGKCWLGKMKKKKKDKCLFLQQCIHCIDMQDLDMTDHNESLKKQLIWNHLSPKARPWTEWNTRRSTWFTTPKNHVRLWQRDVRSLWGRCVCLATYYSHCFTVSSVLIRIVGNLLCSLCSPSLNPPVLPLQCLHVLLFWGISETRIFAEGL